MDKYISNLTLSIFGRITVSNIFIWKCSDAEKIFLERCEMNDEFCNYYLRRDWVDFGLGDKIVEFVIDSFSPKLFSKMINMKMMEWKKIVAGRGFVATTFRIFPRYARFVQEFQLNGWFSDEYFIQRNFQCIDNSKFIYSLPDICPILKLNGNTATFILY